MSPLLSATLLAWVLGVSGRVVDARTNAPIADARVTLQSDTSAAGERASARITKTDTQGGFAFPDVAPGRYVLSVSTIGYLFFDRVIDVTASAPVDLTIALSEGAGTFRETVDVTASRAGAVTGEGARLELGPAALQDVRGVATDDPMRAVHTLPGVVAGEDLQAEFFLRGSPFRQIGVIVDGMPVRTLLHAVQGVENTGSISMISTDVLERATLQPGAQARMAGDWLGGTLSFDVREGSRARASIRGAVSGTSASIVVEGPITRSKRASVLVAVRRSYLDWLIRKVRPDFESTVGFWDGQFKLTFDVSPTQRLQLVVIGGDGDYRRGRIVSDVAVSHAEMGNTVAQVSWRSTGRRWIATQRMQFDAGDFRNMNSRNELQSRGYTQTLAWRSDVSVALGRGWLIDANAMHERTEGGQMQPSFGPFDPGMAPRAHTTSGVAEIVRRTPAMSIGAGVRASWRVTTEEDPSTERSRSAASPWLLVEGRAGDWTWRAGGGGSSQFPDLFYRYFPRDPVAVERAWSFDAGVEHELSPAFRWSATVFRRDESHVSWQSAEVRLDPATGEITNVASPYYSSTLGGVAEGVDLILTRRPAGRFSGWVGYTYARTTMEDELSGESFPGDADQRHTLNAVGTLRLSYRMRAGATLRIGSNVPLVGYFEEDGDVLRLGSLKNRVRLPLYARLDLRASRTFEPGRRRITLFVEVLNVLDRENIGRAAPRLHLDLTVTGYAERLVPRIPSAGLLIEF